MERAPSRKAKEDSYLNENYSNIFFCVFLYTVLHLQQKKAEGAADKAPHWMYLLFWAPLPVRPAQSV